MPFTLAPNPTSADTSAETPEGSLPSSVRRLFVYDTMLSGEPEHGRLRGARRLGAARTEAAFQLVDLGAYGALVHGGTASVAGEVYSVDRATCAAVDIYREVPILFQRCSVRLDDGTVADAHVLAPDQVRGRRRIPSADWRKRFAPVTSPVTRPWSEWARGRKGQ
jgi:gamma-glutamylcyclotransferase (GGCT)/AIG2-like uncharacterized protein YtfP